MSDITYMTAVMLSALNGETIEHKSKIFSDDVWSICDKPMWNWGSTNYRVAQENSDEN